MPRHKKNHTYNREKIYAVYKGEKFICCGNWGEVVDKLQVSEHTMRYYISKSYYNRIRRTKNKNRIVVITLEGLEEGDFNEI